MEQYHEIFSFIFFHESNYTRPLILTLEWFPIFPKIPGDIRKTRCTTGVTPMLTTSVEDKEH